jgi:hypothetical protein
MQICMPLRTRAGSVRGISAPLIRPCNFAFPQSHPNSSPQRAILGHIFNSLGELAAHLRRAGRLAGPLRSFDAGSAQTPRVRSSRTFSPLAGAPSRPRVRALAVAPSRSRPRGSAGGPSRERLPASRAVHSFSPPPTLPRSAPRFRHLKNGGAWRAHAADRRNSPSLHAGLCVTRTPLLTLALDTPP